MLQDQTRVLPRVSTERQLLAFAGSLSLLLLAGVIVFGLYVVAIAAVALASSVAVEVLFGRAMKRKLDRSWFVTPLIFTLLLPARIPLWMVAVGSAFGTFFAKSLFGGYGKNIFNPALVGALFLTISFPLQMTGQWPTPFQPDAFAGPTPLRILHGVGPANLSLANLLFAGSPGAIGEVLRIGVLVLGLVLIVAKIVDWRIPLAVLATVFAFNGLGQLFGLAKFVDPFYSLITGGLLFGAFFVATDPVTAPTLPWARVLYGVGIGFFIVIIRNFAAFPEGITFAVILMNAIGAQFDSIFKPKPLNQGSEAVSA